MPQERLELSTFAYLSCSSTAYKYDALTNYATGAADQQDGQWEFHAGEECYCPKYSVSEVLEAGGARVRPRRLGGFSNTVNVDVNAINCHSHSRANFRPRIDRVFTTCACISHSDFRIFHTSVRLHASCARAVTGTWC